MGKVRSAGYKDTGLVGRVGPGMGSLGAQNLGENRKSQWGFRGRNKNFQLLMKKGPSLHNSELQTGDQRMNEDW